MAEGRKIPPCVHLAFLYQYEIEHGNRVACVVGSEESGSPLRIYFQSKLKIWATPATAEIGTDVEYWDSSEELGLTVAVWEMMDAPPQVFAGFRCKIHKHIIAGPPPV
jgi:hypothetical protein